MSGRLNKSNSIRPNPEELPEETHQYVSYSKEHKWVRHIVRSKWLKTKSQLSIPASCKTFLPDHAFDPQITGYSGRIGVRIEFTAGEVKPPVKPVVNRSKAVLGMLRHICHRESSAVHSHR